MSNINKIAALGVWSMFAGDKALSPPRAKYRGRFYGQSESAKNFLIWRADHRRKARNKKRAQIAARIKNGD